MQLFRSFGSRRPKRGEGHGLRTELQRFPFHAASKAALGFRGVPVGPEVCAPLRGLTDGERAEVERIVAAWSG
jgi:Dihydrodipicolinate synthase/N-acetylneuraminate lyase